MKSVQIRSYFWSVFSCIWIEYRKIRTRNNSVFGQFSRSSLLAVNYYCKFVDLIRLQESWRYVSGKCWWKLFLLKIKFIPGKTSTIKTFFNKFYFLLVLNFKETFFRDSRNWFVALFGTLWNAIVKTNAPLSGFLSFYPHPPVIFATDLY